MQLKCKKKFVKNPLKILAKNNSKNFEKKPLKVFLKLVVKILSKNQEIF